MLNTIKIIDKSYYETPYELKTFFNSDYIYIPYDNINDVKLPTNNVVKKDTLIVKEPNKIYSSISGNVIGKTNDMMINGKKVDCVIIENDFMETTSKRHGIIRYITDYSKEEVLEILEKYSNYKDMFDKENKILVVSGIDVDPFEHNNSLLINNYSDKILETIDALTSIFNYNETYLIIKNNDVKNVESLNNNIGTYPYIDLKMISDYYPIGNKQILLSEIFNKKELEQEILFLNVEDIMYLYNILKKKCPNVEKYITISGNCIKEPMFVCTKLGISYKELITGTCEITKKNFKIVKNGLIKGIEIANLNEIVTNDTNSIFINTELKEKESKCINCGLCTSRCPVGINPKYIKEHKNADKSKCIHCGLCTYICPSKINFKDCLRDKNE